jgi:multidrug efflux system membrane fusion protein
MRERLTVNKSDETNGDDIIPLRRASRKNWFSKGRAIGLVLLAIMVGLGYFVTRMVITKHLPWQGSDQASLAPGDKGSYTVQDGITTISGPRGGSAPVVTAKAELKDLPFAIHNIGNVEAFSVVNVIAQVGGQLTKVAFTQGQDVRQGDLLFKIDARPYEAQLAQAEANSDRDRSQIKAAIANLQRDMAVQRQNEAALKRDQATQQYADVEVERYQTLVKEGAVSHEQSDQMKTNSDTSGATVLSDRAAIENSKAVVASDQAAVQTAKATLVADQAAADNLRVQLGYTEIRSPVNGRTGALNVYQGNVVRANDTTSLVTINQVEPIYVTFSVPESHLSDIRKAQARGSLRVTARLNGDKKQLQTGQLSFVDNNVDKTTGTIRLRATFQNVERTLWPGQFVDVVLSLPGSAPAVIVPSRAVQSDQSGQSVYLVNPDGSVRYVPVEVERTYGDFSVISKGLKVGDTVVIDGQMKLAPGMKIKVVDPGSPPASS